MELKMPDLMEDLLECPDRLTEKKAMQTNNVCGRCDIVFKSLFLTLKIKKTDRYGKPAEKRISFKSAFLCAGSLPESLGTE